ncbi:MAG: PAS domain-containing protein [Desulfococcaceae bacterium]|jgi:PAS domain S-box-containing protein|nr:PAS domain-containing protein [Desulfococcaceae bacterium]
MKNKKFREYRFSFLISLYFCVCLLMFSFSMLLWIYHSTDRAIHREVRHSFEQRHSIADIIFQEQLDYIEKILKDIQSDPIFSGHFHPESLPAAERLFQEMLVRNQDYDLDLLFLIGLDGRVKINASSPFFDTDGIVREIEKEEENKIPLTGVRRFKGETSDFTTILLGIPLINRADNLVFGHLIGGYVLNKNSALMESIRIQTRSASLAFFESGAWLGSTDGSDSGAAKMLMQTRKKLLPGEVLADKGLLISYRSAAISGQAASLEIMMAIPDHTSDLIYSVFENKAIISILFSFLLLIITVFIIRYLTMPSLQRLLACMESLAAGKLNTPYTRGPITEFNRIGEAMENMAAGLDRADRKRRELEHIVNLSSAVVFVRKAESGWPLHFVSENIRQFGYSPEEFLGKKLTYTDIIYPEDREKVLSEVRQYILGSADEFMQEYRIVCKNKEVRWVDDRTWLQRDVKGNILCYQGIVLDITRRKEADREKAELETRLIRAEKMEAMGMLAGGVAHDLNNILSGILSYPDLLLMTLPEDSTLRAPLLTIKESGERAAAVVQDLLTIARGVAGSRQIVSLNTVIEDYLNSPEYRHLTRLYPHVKVKTLLLPDILPISCSVVHIKKILMNLIQNAMESIDTGTGKNGEIIIRTENRYPDTPLEKSGKILKGEYVFLSVADNGPGIAPEDVKNIFEPFYTKKKMGRSGTGLGLAVVWDTMQDHAGHIGIVSKDSETVFELWFPVCRGEKTCISEDCSLENLQGRGQTVLIIDDEEGQREIASGMLSRLGYTPRALSSGEEALEYLKTHSADILLLDMLMPPGMDGLETYRCITEQYPGQKAVIASGFSESESVRKVLRLGAGQYLKKPYTLHRLGLAIKTELER